MKKDIEKEERENEKTRKVKEEEMDGEGATSA